MKAIEIVEEIERILGAHGRPPFGSFQAQSLVRRERDDFQRSLVVSEIEKLVEKFRMQGGRE